MHRTTTVILARVSLALSLAALLASCNPFRQGAAGNLVEVLQQNVRDEITAVIPEVDRRDAMLDTLDEFQALMTESEALLRQFSRREREMFADYDSTAQDYSALFATTREERRALQVEMLRVHLSLKEMATDEEWPPIAAAQSRAVSERVRAAEFGVFTR
jgi:hypothetical protein